MSYQPILVTIDLSGYGPNKALPETLQALIDKAYRAHYTDTHIHLTLFKKEDTPTNA